MQNLSEELKKIRVAPAMAFGGLTVFPLLKKEAVTCDYVTLAEAFKLDGVNITEVSQGGSVPELRFKNLLKKDIFAADGEALLGAKQHRVLNSSIFVGAGEEVIVPVSCVEQGRWSYDGDLFRKAEYSEFVQSRAAKMESVAYSLKSGSTRRRSNQGAVWDAVASKGRQFGTHSPTESMADIYESKRPALDEYVRKLRLQPGQVGLCCVVDGEICGIELFESPGVLGQFLPRLIRSYAAEVLGNELRAAIVPDSSRVRSLLRKICRADLDEYAAVGKGKELRFSLKRLDGAALMVGERLIHLVSLARRNHSSRRSQAL